MYPCDPACGALVVANMLPLFVVLFCGYYYGYGLCGVVLGKAAVNTDSLVVKEVLPGLSIDF